MLKVRNDQAGDGEYGALRTRSTGEAYRHKGVDLLARPGDPWLAPWPMEITRAADPYGDRQYSGFHWESQQMKGWVFYVMPHQRLIGKTVKRGEPVGIVQDITMRYPGRGMKPHVHLQIDQIDPTIILRLIGLIERLQS
ncbi:MAG: hypothetical protein GWN77_05995 [Gammaproteobacteria bacterium]|nr:hypothetical protein [Gammaproteobacteria bacterium]